jgi:hypothetical protein
MRRATSLRSQTRSATSSSTSSGAPLVDELGALREEGVPGEDELRRVQRENEKARFQYYGLNLQLINKLS